jgi:hypothetical protein
MKLVTGSKKMPLSQDKSIDTFFSVSLVGGQFVVQVNVPTVPNMTADELQAHGLIVQQIQAKGNEVKADLEVTK